jgi:hypothetical protein
MIFWDGFEAVAGYISSFYHGLDCFIRQGYGNAARLWDGYF